MADNKVVVHIKGILRDLSPAERKNVKSDPAPLAEKWGKLQLDMLKKLAELEATDKQMKDAIVAFSAGMRKFRDELPDDSKQPAELLARLCNEQKRVFQEGFGARVQNLKVFEKVIV